MKGFLAMRYAAYCRVSTGSDEQLNSLINQKKFFEEYAEKKGDRLVKIYADRGISGKSMKERPQFLKMLSDSEKDIFDALLVKDISRFARNTVDFLNGIRLLKSRDIDVVFVGANQKVIGESEFVLTVFAALAQEESCGLSKKIIFGKKQGAKRGRVPNIIYGYDKKNTYELSVNESEAECVKSIFEMYALNKMGIRKIANVLNEKKITTKNNCKWNAKTVRRIIENPIYRGVLVNNKSETVDFISASRRLVPSENRYYHTRDELRIVDDTLFFGANNRLEAMRKKSLGKNAGTNRSC